MRYFIAALALAASPCAQIPDGSFVVSWYGDNAFAPGGGLFFVSPRIPGPPTAVSGLGVDLTGPNPAGPMGSKCVAIRQDDGAILVGEITPPGHTVDLHVLTMSGNNAGTDTRITLGTASASGPGAINQIAMLPNGDAILAVSGLTNAPPLFGAGLAVVRRTGTVVPLTAMNSVSSDIRTVAVDDAGTTGYATAVGPDFTQTNIYAFDVPSTGAATFVAQLETMTSLDVEGDGMLLAATSQNGGEIVRIDPSTGFVSPLASTGPFPIGMQDERSTQFVAFLLDGTISGSGEVGIADQGGGVMTLTGGIPGVASGLDVFDNPRIYGAPTAGLAEHRWRHDPSSGSLPRIGNTSFTLTMESTDLDASGGLIASPASAEWSFFGVDVLLDPTRLIPFGYVPTNGAVNLAIPMGTPIGLSLCFQSFYLDGGVPFGVGASDGIRITIMP